jgi:hypothetical protein
MMTTIVGRMMQLLKKQIGEQISSIPSPPKSKTPDSASSPNNKKGPDFKSKVVRN